MATRTKAKQAAQALKADTEKISKANETAQKPARKANREKLAKHVKDAKQEMDNHAVAVALAKVKRARDAQ